MSNKHISFDTFCERVNAIARAKIEKIKKDPTRLFGCSSHINYPKHVLKRHFDDGHTPSETYKWIVSEHIADGRAEARAS
jgi:hypothetical protein